MNLRLLSVAAACCFLTACSGDIADFEKQYLELNSLIQESITTNNTTKPDFVKKVVINGEEEEITTSEIDWEKELEVFLSVDLNKRDYLNKYKIDSSFQQVKYTLLSDMEAPVKEVSVKLDSTSRVSSIYALLKTTNFLYDSERNLALNFADGKLAAYEVSGWQQLFIGDKKFYGIKAKRAE